MLPGPTIIKSCPHCKGLAKEKTLASGNTFGAKWWTDGAFRARMLPGTPDLIKCQLCSSVAWLSDCEEVDRFSTYHGFRPSLSDAEKKEIEDEKKKQALYKDAPYIEEASPDEMVAFIETNDLTDDEELSLRVRAWRKWNDSRRLSDQYNPMKQSERENLAVVASQLSERSECRLLHAEAERELGNLKVARELIISGEFPKAEESVAQQILELIEAQDSQVCQITEDADLEWRILRRRNSRNSPNPPFPGFDKDGPPVMTIKSRSWWVKPLEMISHNWALIEENQDESATVYFFHDLGIPKGSNSGYTLKQLKGRCAVVDSLDFAYEDLAKMALKYNGFRMLQDNPGPWDGYEPFGTFYDARNTEEGVYSKGGYWKPLRT